MPEAGFTEQQRYWSLLPPVRARATRLEVIQDGRLWTLTQPLGFPLADAGLRMTALRLDDGTLWVNTDPVSAVCVVELSNQIATILFCGWVKRMTALRDNGTLWVRIEPGDAMRLVALLYSTGIMVLCGRAV